MSARRSHSSLPNDILSRIESVIQVIPRLFTKHITLRKHFAFKFDVCDMSRKQIGIATKVILCYDGSSKNALVLFGR
jgi:hypothetical protein